MYKLLLSYCQPGDRNLVSTIKINKLARQSTIGHKQEFNTQLIGLLFLIIIILYTCIIPEIGKGKGSNRVDLEEAQHCPGDSQTGHVGTPPIQV